MVARNLVKAYWMPSPQLALSLICSRVLYRVFSSLKVTHIQEDLHKVIA